ncbi:MAG: response regulator [Chthoniobacteraceae bacterium]
MRKILIVDDSEFDVELTMNALQENHVANGLDVARDGAEALDYLYRRGAFATRPNQLPTVVLLDLKMPKVDGLEVLRTMKSEPAFKMIPVVMLTSSREEQDLLKCYDLGANAYVVKPVDFAEFVNAVKQLGVFWALINEIPPPPQRSPLPMKTGASEDRKIYVIHLEDDPLDREWVSATLSRSGINMDLVQVDNHEAFLSALSRQQPDIIISDYSMPGYNGVKALQLVKLRRTEAPFIFFSGTMGEDAAIESLKNGATDYVLKQHPERLIAAVRRALQEAGERRARMVAEEKIREQAALLDEARDAICLNDLDQVVLYWNKGAERLYGWSREEAVGRNANELLLQNNVLTAMKTLISDGEWQGELRQTTRSGGKLTVQSRWTLIRDDAGLPK